MNNRKITDYRIWNHNRISHLRTLLLTALLGVILATLVGCGSKSGDAVSVITKQVENKYGLVSGELKVVQSSREPTGPGIPFANPGDVPVYVTYQTADGRAVHGYGVPDGGGGYTVYDDCQYPDVFRDVVTKYKDQLQGAERVTIGYNKVRSHLNMLPTDQIYEGDLSGIDLTRIRIDYVDRDLSECEFHDPEIPDLAYLMVSYRSRQDMDDWYVQDLWDIPKYAPMGIQAMKSEDSYQEYFEAQFGDVHVTASSQVEIVPYEGRIEAEGLAENGCPNGAFVSEAFRVITDGDYSVYLKATDELTFDRATDIPVYLGYSYLYKGDYAYHTTFCRYENGWIHATGKAKYEGLRFVVNSELLKKEYK